MIKDKISSRRGAEVLEYIRKVYLHETLDLTDGIKIIGKNSWALVRASGTEPIIRIIVDSENRDFGHEFHSELMNHISAANK
jgi:phosphomannomutase/phosphoglucomutase